MYKPQEEVNKKFYDEFGHHATETIKTKKDFLNFITNQRAEDLKAIVEKLKGEKYQSVGHTPAEEKLAHFNDGINNAIYIIKELQANDKRGGAGCSHDESTICRHCKV